MYDHSSVISYMRGQVELLQCLEKKSTDVMCKKRMENQFRSGLLSAGSVADLTEERPQTCLLCLIPLLGIVSYTLD